MPYSAIPQRPASKRASGSRSVPAELARCRTQGGKPSATRAKARTCCRANAVSVSSAVARWLISPQSRGPGVPRASASVRPTATAASGSRPQRPMPVSTLTCTPRSVRSRTRAQTSSVPTTISSPPAWRSSPGASGPMHDHPRLGQRVAQRPRLAERRDAQRLGALVQRDPADVDRAVPVAVGLDDGEQCARAERLAKSPDVGADRAKLDDDPRALRQRVPNS